VTRILAAILAAVLLSACGGEPDRCGLAAAKHQQECAGVPVQMESAK
jgi:hypothetical protein